MTATVETVSEQLDLAAIIPAEKVVSAVARAITLSESDVGMLRGIKSTSFINILQNYSFCNSRTSKTTNNWRQR